jgi:lipoprotein-anchoring transpeptidase ErfK/SrfK
LDGLELGVNRGGEVDSYKRYIYIHGTNHEEKVGTPSSSGCLQMLNSEIIELFSIIPIGTHLFISLN